MMDRLIYSGRCYIIDMNVENRGNEYLKAIIPSTDDGRTKKTRECGIFQTFE